MSRILQVIRIGLFILLIGGPTLVLLWPGPVQPYGFKFGGAPSLGAVLADAPDGRQALSTFVIDRSWLKREAISLSNRLMYSVLGYLDTRLVISGLDGWLFYKPEFYSGSCMGERSAVRDLAHLDTMMDMAAVSGLRLVLAIAPDKSMVYPEKFHPRARKYWSCRVKSGSLWRRLAPDLAPGVLDLAESINAAKEVHREPLYFVADTHWTRLGAAVARRQLAETLTGSASGLPPPRVVDGVLEREADLAKRMMLRLPPEQGPDIDPREEQALAAILAGSDLGETVILHDSFVNYWPADFRAMLPGDLLYATSANADGDVVDAIGRVDTAVALFVERSLFRRWEIDIAAWRGPIGRGIIARNRSAAAKCSFSDNEQEGAAGQPTAVAKPDGDPSSGIVVTVPVTPEGTPCIALAVAVDEPSTLVLSLPGKASAEADSPHPTGREVYVPVTPDDREVRLLLPHYVMGKTIRLGRSGDEPVVPINRIRFGTDHAAAP